MAIDVQSAVPDDATVLAHVANVAHEHSILHGMVLKLSGATQQQKDEYWQWRIGNLKERIAKPGGHYFKAIDTSTGEIVGFSAIIEPPSGKEEEAHAAIRMEGKSPEIFDTDLMSKIDQQLKGMRKQLMGERKDFCYIPSLAVHPGHQRKGIGQALLDAVLQVATKIDRDAYLESTPAGAQFYRANGLEEIGQLTEMGDDLVHPVFIKRIAKTA